MGCVFIRHRSSVRSWIWRHFEIELPDDWELLQFSRERDVGRCAFADRYRFSCELNWRVVKGPPDFGRMVSDYRAKLEEEGLQDARLRDRDSWHGVQGRQDQGFSSRYGCYFAEAGCLLEAVFLWPKQWDAELENRILGSIRYAPPAEGVAAWRAFGMDFRVDASLALGECTALPAHAEMVFARRSGRLEQRFARRGMVGEWLQIPLENWIQTWIPKGFRVLPPVAAERSNHRIVRLTGVRRSPTLQDALRGRLEVSAAAWLCPRDDRLYSLSSVFSSRRSPARGSGRLSCCSAMEVVL